MTHILEGRLKVAAKEADKEKALKQVSESTLNERVLKLASMKQRPIAAKMAQDSAKQKAGVMQGKLRDWDQAGPGWKRSLGPW